MNVICKNITKIIMLLCITVVLFGCKPDAVDSSGKPIKISNYRGKWVIIQYWATWCAPCMNQISELNKLVGYYKNHVVVLGVNYDHLADPILHNLKDQYEVKYALLNNFPIENFGASKVNKIPMLFILNPKGHLQYTFDTIQTFQDLQKLLNLPPINYENL